MSDDDCDIFSLPIKRPIVMPTQTSIPEQEVKQSDYDFININLSITKPNKATKPKAQAQPKPNTKAARQKKQTKNAELNKAEQVLQEAQAISERELSPVSVLIDEMEKREAAEQAKRVDALPIARRTRSSIGKSDPIPEKQTEHPVQVVSAVATKKRNIRGKKKATKDSIQNPTINVEASNITRPRGNRQQLAELAARSKVLDSIDLVSAVMPRVEGFINLDSGDECQNTVELENPIANKKYEFNVLNQEIEINLCWLGEIQKYKLRQHQKFMHMFKEVAARNKVSLADVFINKDDQFISPNESPETIGYMSYHILNGCAIKSITNNTTERVDNTNLHLKPKKFQLKIQADKWKQPLIIQMKKSEAFNILYIKCAEEMECDVDNIKLFFDGDLLDPHDTPKNQDMEGNEMIDLRFK